MKSFFFASAIATSAFLAPLSANAALISSAPPNCSVTDFDIINATACSGAWKGNDKNQMTDVLAELAGLSGLTSWGFDGSSDQASGGPFTGNPATNDGTLTFDSALSGPFALALKAGNDFSLYYFDGMNVNLNSLDFMTTGIPTNGNNNRDLSHASLYTTNAATAVPTPALLPGLIGLGMSIVRKRRQQTGSQDEEI